MNIGDLERYIEVVPEEIPFEGEEVAEEQPQEVEEPAV